jgi:hypothetical protein
MPTIASERLQARFRFTERVSVMARSLVCTLRRAWLYHPWPHDRSPSLAQWERMFATMRTIALPTAANACTKPPKMASVVDGDLTVMKMIIATNSQIHQRHSSLIMAPPQRQASPDRARYGAELCHSST